MASPRARLMAMEERFRMSMPRMCVYCKAGCMTVDAPGDVHVACMNTHRMPRTPKTVDGGKRVPPVAMAVLMMAPNGVCDRFSPIGMHDGKAALLDALGYFDDLKGLGQS